MDSSRSLLFTFAHSKVAKVGGQEFPSEITAHSKARTAINFLGDALLSPQRMVPSSHQIPEQVLPLVWQSKDTQHQGTAPLPAHYMSVLPHKDTHFFAQAGTVLQKGKT